MGWDNCMACGKRYDQNLRTDMSDPQDDYILCEECHKKNMQDPSYTYRAPINLRKLIRKTNKMGRQDVKDPDEDGEDD